MRKLWLIPHSYASKLSATIRNDYTIGRLVIFSTIHFEFQTILPSKSIDLEVYFSKTPK